MPIHTHSCQPTTPSATAPIAITQGDSAGIGPEIIVQAWLRDRGAFDHCLIVGDVATFERACTVLGSSAAHLRCVRIHHVDECSAMPAQTLPIFTPTDMPSGPAPWGQISAHAGEAAAAAVRWAAQAALAGHVRAIVTAPLHKEALHAAGVNYPGHTELLQALSAAHVGVDAAHMPVRMMLANAELRVVLHTIHIALRQAIATLDAQGLLQSLRITHEALRPILGRAPRIAVPGLNPHAGEGGLFGDEEALHIAPAIAAARAQGLDVHGPFAPDTVFMRARQGAFDVVLALYHDQGLIPIKYMGLDEGVNITLGLPLIRTSPDHGTAFDLAGTGRADCTSLLAALRMARTLSAPPPNMPQR